MNYLLCWGTVTHQGGAFVSAALSAMVFFWGDCAMTGFGTKGAVAKEDAKPDGLKLPHPDAKTVHDRTKNVAIGVLAVSLGIVICTQFAKPPRPYTPDATSVTLAPRTPL